MLSTFRGGGYKPLKTKHFACSLTLALVLSLALSLALSFSSVLPAFAETPTPTLDKLHEAGVTMPDSTEVYPESAYTLTKIEVQDPSNLPANTITKYEWSETENKLTPVYYRLDLKQTDYGHTKDYDDVKTYDITRPIDPNSDKNAFEYAINYYVNNDSLSTDRITTDQLGKDIDIDFVGLKYEPSSGYAEGGAIFNDGTIGNITGDFIGNYAKSENWGAEGGAINNYSEIGDITGDFIGNYASGPSYTYGGAIDNGGTIGNIAGDFIGNYAFGDIAALGVIYNSGNATIGNITGDFIGNYVSGDVQALGGVIYNQGTIGNITADFIGNYAQGENVAFGGAIYNEGTIGNITGDFIGNYAKSENGDAYGGAIDNASGTIGDITGDFIGNYASGNIAAGGAIVNGGGTIGNITGDFIGNYAKSTNGIAIGGAIMNQGIIGTVNQDTLEITYGEIKNSSFIGNYAESTNGTAIGGAIFSASHLNITADNAQSVFSGNKTISSGIEEQNAIGMYGVAQKQDDKYVFLDLLTGTQSDKNPASLTLKAVNNGVIVFDDTIRGGGIDVDSMQIIETPETAYDLSITGDTTGKVILNNDIINANISLDNTNLYLGRENIFDQSQSLSLNSGNLYLNNNSIGTMHVPTLNLNGNTNLSVDVDLANKQMDRITADNYNITNNDAFINVNNINLLSDSNQQSTSILFADEQLANNVQYTGISPIAYSPIYKYDVSYSTNPEDNLGYFFFNRASSSSGNQSDAFNPAVLTPSVATQAGAYTTQLQTFNYAFQHSDSFMNIPSLDRLSIINNNKYALNTTNFSPLLTPHSHNGFWVKPYASFESIPLNNGPTVSNINYGTLIGYDSDIKQINHGFNRVLTAYIGYNGASQRYQGVDAYQNGGILGSTATFYKGNFFNATTVSVGASVGDATTMYGSENYTMLMAGIGNKFGYNFEFKQGKYILQPNFLMSYSFINTFDYTNAANVRIESDPLHALQLSPGIKFIMNTKNGWQPYLAVNMTWNILDETKVTANDVRLPSMSIDPYVSYGAGIQKCFKDDRFTAYGQAMVHNGGRNGVSLTAGFRWRVGKD